ncbi:hypothetical protein ABBQ38_007433 [Trebouxia sp. C0009 RCD-2024]
MTNYGEARARTPQTFGPDFRDEYTRVAISGIETLAMAFLHAKNASQEICSPAKFVNTNAPKKCNCRFVAKDGLIYLVTNKDIATREELIAEYTHGKGYHAPSWPKTFLGCAEKEKSKFAEYLQNPPGSATKQNHKEALLLLGGVLHDLLAERPSCQLQATPQMQLETGRQATAERGHDEATAAPIQNNGAVPNSAAPNPAEVDLQKDTIGFTEADYDRMMEWASTVTSEQHHIQRIRQQLNECKEMYKLEMMSGECFENVNRAMSSELLAKEEQLARTQQDGGMERYKKSLMFVLKSVANGCSRKRPRVD